MLRNKVLLALVFGLVALVSWASPELSQNFHDVPFELFTLDNGLTVILSEDHSAPTYSICVVYDVGSRDEARGKTGYAHLFEHMMFQGSENVGKGEHSILIQRNGGVMNGTTTTDRTNYYQTLPANQIGLGLFLEADRMRSLDISDVNLENQRQAVKEERRLRVDNAPYGRTFEAIAETAYDTFGYRHPTIGLMEDLDAATLVDVQRFFNAYYAPNNATLALVGDFDTEEVLEKVEMYFGDIPPRSRPPEMLAFDTYQEMERRTTVRDPFARLPRLDIVFRAPPGNTGDWYILAVMADILAGGTSSRLYQRLVREERAAVNAGGGLSERRGPSLVQFVALPTPGTDLDTLESIIYEEIEKLQTGLVEDWEMEKVLMQIERRNAQSMRSTLSRAMSLAENEVFYNNPGLINTSSERYGRVTKEGVRRAAELYLQAKNRTVVITLPMPGGGGR
jgi:zinc protease